MKKLHVTELTDDEFTAVFKAAAGEAVARAKAQGAAVPSMTIPAANVGRAVDGVHLDQQRASSAARKKARA